MDKVTRILMLYSKLLRGEVVDKQRFCLETDSCLRSFDRDIEDVRLFLSESFHTGELVYDRKRGGYLLTEAIRQPLEQMEYLLVEKVMLDSGILRRDEMEELLFHIASQTKRVKQAADKENYDRKRYVAPEHGRPLMKMFEDLNAVIDSRQVIRIYSEKLFPDHVDAIPCEICCHDREIWLLAFAAEEGEELRIPLGEIESFSIIRNQNMKEKRQADKQIKRNQEAYNGKKEDVF